MNTKKMMFYKVPDQFLERINAKSFFFSPIFGCTEYTQRIILNLCIFSR